ncbi:MAG: signal transduction histidine kinase [Cellvibrionaceae bacterium]|jgi:signal transduction histidine kinase
MTLGHIDKIQTMHDLWIRLSKVLSGVFDTHGVCAAIAQEVSAFTGCNTMTALAEPNDQYFDVWFSNKNGNNRQERWRGKREAVDNLLQMGEIKFLSKTQIAPTHGAVYDMASSSLLIVPLPWPKSDSSIVPNAILIVADAEDTVLADLVQIEHLAIMFTTWLERAVLHYQRDRQAIEFAITSDISQRLSATLRLEDVFSQVSDNIKRMLDVESLSIGLIQQHTGDIVFIPQLMGMMFLAMPPIKLKSGAGIAGWVVENRQAAIINDVYNDNRFSSDSDMTSGFLTKSMICVPLQQKDKVIGVIQAINKRNGEFGLHDKDLLEAVSGSLSAAIVNANLHENVVSEKRRIDAMFQSMSEGLLTVGADHCLTQANDSLMTLLSIGNKKGNENIIGEKVTKIIQLKEKNILQFMSELSVYRPKHKLADYPQLLCDIRVGNVYKPVMISGAPVREDDGGLDEIVLVISDLTDIREVERMRDDFFHAIIHELRTPLATILLYARMLLKGNLNDEEKTQRFLKNIETESDRLQAMVRQMLQHAKLEASEFLRTNELLDVNKIFDEILPSMRDRAVEKELVFVHHIQSNLPEIMGDPETIYMVVKNLIDNAVKYTLDGKVEITAESKRSKIHITIQDEGIGIPKQAMPQLFGRFFRAQTAVEKGIAGTGLGLNMVKEGVEKHGGKIKVKSTAGKGTTFLVELPIAKKQLAKKQPE